MVLSGINSGDVVSTPITFDAGIPVPTMTVDPSTNLGFRGLVAVHGRNLTPDSAYSASECFSGGICSSGATGTSNAAGELDLTVPVRRLGFRVDETGVTPIDCLTPSVTCTLRLIQASGFNPLTSVLTFDPLAPIPPPPTLVVDPAIALGARQLVTVTGSGFLPNAAVTLQECAATRNLLPGFAFCTGSSVTQ